MLLLFKIAVSHLNLLRERDSNPRPPGYEPDELPLLYPTIFQKKHSIAPPVPDFVFRETVYVQVFWFVRTIIHPAEGDCLELHAYETTVVMSQHLSCIQDEMFYLYPQKD